MIRGLGDETFSAYSQTLNGQVNQHFFEMFNQILGWGEVKGVQSFYISDFQGLDFYSKK
jgi:hypothetical protein